MRVLRVSFLVLVAAVSVLRCGQALPEQATVRRVIDGDTIELTDGRLIRYLGIDTPELRRREGDRWVIDPEPFGQDAKDANARLVEGKTVTLEYDAQTHDRYGRLLAYVYVDGQMVNAKLLEEGYASALTIPPNVRYTERFRRLVQKARRTQRGLWAPPMGGGAPAYPATGVAADRQAGHVAPPEAGDD